MSTLRVKVVKIQEVSSHPNADRLEIAQINGWQCVVGKGNYKSGDLAVYFPIDSILPESIEAKLFGPDSKIKLNNHRIKTIKIRGAISQGMLATLKSLDLGFDELAEGVDLTNFLGITKYEPKEVHVGVGNTKAVTKRFHHPDFHKYTSIENFKNYNNLFVPQEPVIVTEKVHGTNARFGLVKKQPKNIIEKILKFCGLLNGYEFVYGSHNVQLSNESLKTLDNVYAKIAVQYDIRARLRPEEVIYGEIYGDGIQKGYKYGCEQGEHRFAIFDVKVGDSFLDWEELEEWARERKLPTVPVLYKGPFDLETIKKHVDGDSVLAPKQKVREGVVIKPAREGKSYIGRKILKLISDLYLLKDQSDFH